MPKEKSDVNNTQIIAVANCNYWPNECRKIIGFEFLDGAGGFYHGAGWLAE